MTVLLDLRAAERLARICGMFGSDHNDERAAAAAKAIGLTWPEIDLPPRKPDTIEALIDSALDGDVVLDPWEHGFLRGIRGRQRLTEKQLANFDSIVAKVRAGRRAA